MSDNIRTALYDADYTVHARLAGLRRAADARRASSASTARAATSSSRTRGCPPTSRPATCSPSPATGAYCRSHGQQLQPRACGRRWSRSRRRERRGCSCGARREDDLLGSTWAERHEPVPRDATVRVPARAPCEGWETSRSGPDSAKPPPVSPLDRATDGMRRRGRIMGAQPLRVALLGCGVVGSEVARLLHDAGRRPRRAGRRAARAGRHRRPAP